MFGMKPSQSMTHGKFRNGRLDAPVRTAPRDIVRPKSTTTEIDEEIEDIVCKCAFLKIVRK